MVENNEIVEQPEKSENLAVFGEKERRSAKNIAIKDLFLGELNERIDPGDIEGLSRSIKQVGVLEPLLVRPVGDRYEIIAGNRRFNAARLAGVTSVPCIVKEMDDISALRASFQENEERKSANPLEYGMLCWKMAQRTDNLKEVADLLGKTQAWVESRINAYELFKRANVISRERGGLGHQTMDSSSTHPALGIVDANHIMQAVQSPAVRRHVAQSGEDPDSIKARMVRQLSEAFPKLTPTQRRKLISEFKKNPNAQIDDLTRRVLNEPQGIKVSISFNAEISGRIQRQVEKTGDRTEAWIRRIVIEHLNQVEG
jgi:ParB/RepB/Spo0J family partition protein